MADFEAFEKQIARPLLTIITLFGLMMGLLQWWLATRFVSHEDLDHLRESLRESHRDHMDDYKSIELELSKLNRALEESLHNVKERDTDN